MNARAFTQAAPLVVLGCALGALIFHAVPDANKDVVIAIVSGLLGYLTKEAQQAIAPAKPPPAPVQDASDPQP